MQDDMDMSSPRPHDYLPGGPAAGRGVADGGRNALTDFLNHESPLNYSVASPPGPSNGPASGADFGYTDLLAEFTLAHPSVASPAQNHLSPRSQHMHTVNSPASGYSGSAAPQRYREASRELYFPSGDAIDSKSPEELLLEHYGVSPIGEKREGYEFDTQSRGRGHSAGTNQVEHDGMGGENPVQANQLAQAIAGMDQSTQQQLLSALLSQQTNGADPPDQHQLLQNPIPPPPNYYHPPHSSSSLRQPHSTNNVHPSGTRSHPQSRSNSQHPSPQSFHIYSSIGPSPLPHLQIPAGIYPSQPSQSNHNTSQPTSHVSSPLASPYTTSSHQVFPGQNVGQPISLIQLQQQQQAQSQHNQQSPLAHGSYPSAASSASGSASNTRDYQQTSYPPRSQSHYSTGQRIQDAGSDMQAQITMEGLERGPASQGTGGERVKKDMGSMRGGSATGGSYATTTDDTDWADREYMFSPLMSPALTSYSGFSSMPPSTSSLPSNPPLQTHTHIAPAEIFTPLGSPAILPQLYSSDGKVIAVNTPAYWQQQQQHLLLQQQQQGNLQGLVDQTKALGFDPNGTNTSPQSYLVHSPRMLPVGAGNGGDAKGNTATGSGRRGAGNKKARPSPLLKPTPDGALVRRKKGSLSGTTGEKSAAGSMGSGGGRSTTTSPFLGSTFTNAGMGMTSSSRTSPAEGEGSINTPSPVDLAMNLDALPPLLQQSQTQNTAQSSPYAPADFGPNNNDYLVGFMGPPPPPSSASHSRRESLQSGAGATGDWMNPVTPATFMNFPTEHPLLPMSLHLPSPSLSSTPTANYFELNPEIDPQLAQYDISTDPLPPPIASLASTSIQVDYPPQLSTTGSQSSGTTAKGKGKRLAGGRVGAEESSEMTPGSSASGATVKGKGRAVGGAAQRKVGVKGKKTNAGDLLINSKANYDPTASTPANNDSRRTSHKAAEQKRRDSLKSCFEDLRRILPPMNPSDVMANEEDRRPGEGNVGGQRGGSVDPENPNKGVSKVALLRRSNEYVQMLEARVQRRDRAIYSLRDALVGMRERLGEEGGDEIEGLDLDRIDADEKEARGMAYYECMDSDEETTSKSAKKGRRKSINVGSSAGGIAGDEDFVAPNGAGAKGGRKPVARRSMRKASIGNAGVGEEENAMDVLG